MAKRKVKGQVDIILLITVILLLSLGIIMVLSASSPSSFSKTGSSYTYVKRQAFAAILGLVVMFLVSKIDYKVYNKLAILALIISFLALIIVPIAGFEVKGAKRWLNLGFTTIQPSEIAKVGLIIFFAHYLSKYKDKIKKFMPGFVYPLAIAAVAAYILVKFQDHFSAALIIILVTSIMMICAGTKIIYFLTFGLTAAVGAVAIVLKKGDAFRLGRIQSWLNPWADPTGDAFQEIQSLYAIGSGGLFGAGLGQSKQKYLYIPEPHNDFIFAILAEELGFVGCAIVIILFALFIWRGIVIALKAPDTFGSLLAVGITSLIGLQAIINIAVVTASMPVTGMPLPFFSYGGTSLIILLASVGILLNISRQSQKI